MIYTLDHRQCTNFELSSRREWILTNGIGGFAMGTVSGANMRRYHGHLVSANPAPDTRTVLLANIEASMQGSGPSYGISCNQYSGTVHPTGYEFLREFQVGRFARWVFSVDGITLEKQLVLHKGLNAVTVRYVNVGDQPIGLVLRPLVCHKFYHGNSRASDDYPQEVEFPKNQSVITYEGRSLVLNHPGAQRLPAEGWYYRFEYEREVERGLDPRDDLYCPCELRYELLPGEFAELTASDGEQVIPEFDWQLGENANDHVERLRAATNQFLIQTTSRTTIIAGYPWFTDWGRDTMISIPGILLVNGRFEIARQILRDYASQMSDGLIPNRFVENQEIPEYNTVDATLWFAHAAYRTLSYEWDEEFAVEMAKAIENAVRHHVAGARYGIRVDSKDGLLTQGQEGVQLTWMDAKIGDWVVTPRHGKPVEINGLWINALRVLIWIRSKLELDCAEFEKLAAKAEGSFESVFWKESLGYYLDTAGPDDASLRPNQVIAMSLPFSPCTAAHSKRALEVVQRELLTEYGLRTLAPSDSNYRGKFSGQMVDLDSAYHQGTVWPWLLGPYVSAIVKFNADRTGARRLLKKSKEMLDEYGIGGIAEVYDGEAPQKPGACPWQAWSVAEWLRAWVEDVGEG